ncbi:MAG: WD40 repeat domain-containing protein, partial [Candidatus Promineifilaceae bacterium]|nr:WD40 repeat domain-containing protein [Candidatus Promineifilaceae bacterium]
ETAELVHEALIAHWGRLHGWLDEDRAFRLWQERLRAALSQWRTSERDEGALLRGAPLVEAEGWLASHRRRLSDDECAFVDASAAVRARRRQEREQARLARERQRRRIAIGLAVGLVIALGLAGLAAWQWNRARRTVDELQVERGRTQTALANALANQALAELDRQRDFALLLSVEAVQRADTTVALDSLLTALDDSRYLQRFLHGAQDDVRTIAYHPDGDRLVSGDAAGNIILWNIVTGARLGDSIDGHDDQLAEVAFSPDGSQLASAGFDDVVVLWDLTAEEPAQLARLNHPDNVWAVAFSPDGQTLATAAADGAVRLWSAAGDPLEGTWPRFASQATTVTFSPDGRLLAAGDGDGTIVLWDLEAAGPIGPPPSVHTGLVRDLAFSPDGHWLASASHDQTIILWDVAASEPIGQPLTAHDDWVTGVSFSPAGNRLASSSRDGRLRIWTLDAWLRSSGQETPILVQTFGGTDSPLWTVVFGPKTDTLVSAGSSGFLTLWDLTAPSPWVDRTVALNIDETMMPVEDRLFIDVAFSPKNDTVAVAAVSEVLRPDTDGLVFLAEMSSQKGSKVTLRQPGESILTIAFGPDGHRLLSGGRYGSLQLWDVDPESATFGQSLDDPLVGRVSNVTDVVFHPNGELAATFDGRVSVWDLSAKEMVIPPLSTSARDGAVIFSPDGSLLASTSGLGGVSIWDLEHDELTSVSISDQGSPLIRLAIAGGGAFLATSNDTGRVNLWDLVDNQPLTSFDLQTNPFWDMKLSLDGRLLAALSLTYELSFWEPWTGQRIGPWLSGESQRSQALQLSPDGRQLAVVSSPEGIITLWDFDPQSWQEKACQRANRNLTQEEWQRLFGQEPYRPTCPDLPAPAAGS